MWIVLRSPVESQRCPVLVGAVLAFAVLSVLAQQPLQRSLSMPVQDTRAVSGGLGQGGAEIPSRVPPAILAVSSYCSGCSSAQHREPVLINLFHLIWSIAQAGPAPVYVADPASPQLNPRTPLLSPPAPGLRPRALLDLLCILTTTGACLSPLLFSHLW